MPRAREGGECAGGESRGRKSGEHAAVQVKSLAGGGCTGIDRLGWGCRTVGRVCWRDIMSTAVTIKNIPIARPSFSSQEERAVVEVLRSGWVSQGPRVLEFEQRFAEYVGAAQGVAVSSCTTALHLALLAAGIKPGDEVLCPSLSFIATANAIPYAGAPPVFWDIDTSTYNMDPSCIVRSITT